MRTIMIVSLSATWLSVKYGSPSDRWLHTNTIAVHGAAASRMRPGDVAVDLVGGQVRRERRGAMKIQPRSAIENGFTAQLTKSVTPIPRQCCRTWPIAREVDPQQHRNDHDPDEETDRAR